MATLTLYNYSGPLNTINKTLTGGTIKTGTQVDTPQSLTDMQIIIESATAPTWNYCTMSDTGRNYFITNIDWLGGKAFMLTLHVDVLTSNKTAIDALYAMVEYSTKGDPLEYDARLNYKDQITRTHANGESILTQTPTPYMIVRFYNAPPKYSLPEPLAPTTRVNALVMTPLAFLRFCDQLYDNNVISEANRLIFCNHVIDVSVAYHCGTPSPDLDWVNTFQLRTPTATITYNVLTGTGEDFLWFQLEGDNAQLPFVEYKVGDVPLAWECYLSGKYTIHVPYLGDFTFCPADMGIKTAASIYLDVAVDYFSATYICTPRVGAYNEVGNYQLKEMNQSVEIATKTPMALDQGFDAYNLHGIENAISYIDDGLTALGNIPSLLGVATTATSEMLGTYKTSEQKYISNASNFKRSGGMMNYIPTTPTQNVIIERIAKYSEPDTNPTVFWPAWGYPDHQIRLLSTLTDGDYFKCEKVQMRGFSTITKAEVDEIERLLLSGVYA